MGRVILRLYVRTCSTDDGNDCGGNGVDDDSGADADADVDDDDDDDDDDDSADDNDGSDGGGDGDEGDGHHRARAVGSPFGLGRRVCVPTASSFYFLIPQELSFVPQRVSSRTDLKSEFAVQNNLEQVHGM
uniref:Uncharacterized protein n=1 Tax=Setaria digitata TaxID=48799 RepID=A0A915Q6R5_9BILA